MFRLKHKRMLRIELRGVFHICDEKGRKKHKKQFWMGSKLA